MQTHPRQSERSLCREQAGLHFGRSLTECDKHQCTWAVCSSGWPAWSLLPPEGMWPDLQQHQPVHQQIWPSAGRWSQTHPYEGGLSCNKGVRNYTRRRLSSFSCAFSLILKYSKCGARIIFHHKNENSSLIPMRLEICFRFDSKVALFS